VYGVCCVFFFQAEDGIRDWSVTGVQTCALPIWTVTAFHGMTNPLAMPWNAVTIPGVLSALAATIAWALGSVLYRRGKWESTFWQQVFWQLAVSGIVLVIPAVILEWHHPIRFTPQLIVNTIYNILVPTALAFWCWSQALTRMRASTASQILLLSPVFGITQSHFVLGEPLTPAVLASAACVITGACLTFWRPASK